MASPSNLRAGLLLFGATAAALVWANFPQPAVAAAYADFWDRACGPLSLRLWINDAWMAIFFLAVGLEIRLSGALSGLPLAAALGGMVVPAAVYALVMVTCGQPVGRGWAIPMATDIAFALGVLSLLRVPTSLRLFLTALAVADDLGAVVVIAVFFTAALDWAALGTGLAALAASFGWARRGAGAAGHVVLGLVAWAAFLRSGVHPTVAGVLLALTLPVALAQRWERAIQPWSAHVIMPVFAFANAGVSFRGEGGGLSAVAFAILGGLVLGKPLGIFGGARLAARLRPALWPADLSARRLGGAACLGGIGFTMSLFVAGLAFGGGAAADSAKMGILLSSFVAAGFGTLILRGAGREGPKVPNRAGASSARPS